MIRPSRLARVLAPSPRPAAFVFEVVLAREAYNPVLVLDFWERAVGAARNWVEVVEADAIFDPNAEVPTVRMRARVSVPNAGFGRPEHDYDEAEEQREALEAARAALWGLGEEGTWAEV